MSQLHILMVASEATPWAKTGGLADVVGALPEVLDQLGHTATVVIPRYQHLTVPDGPRIAHRVSLGSVGYDATLHVVALSERRRVVLVDVPALFDRPGLYGVGGQDFPDNAERFAVLAAAALDFLTTDHGWPPVDIVHGHDWQAALVPVLARTQSKYRSVVEGAALVLTIHNLAFQGVFDRDVVQRFGLPWSVFTMETGEFWGRFSFLKAGITHSDIVTTVSPTYRQETRRPGAGAGLDGVLAALGDRYVGILNGIDTGVWNPSTDPWLPAHFDVGNLDGKQVCKRDLLKRFNFPVGDDALARPVVSMVSRLTDQKGLELIQRAMPELAELDATWIFVGTGEARYERFLQEMAARYPSRVGVHIGFDEGLAHLAEAGADLFLMPSVFEPCGLNQMYSLRYGAVPIVSAVGGLDDTIRPYTTRARHANGFKFRDQSAPTLVRTVKQALRLYHDKTVWGPLMERGMTADHSWQTSAREYVKVYRRARQLVSLRGGH